MRVAFGSPARAARVRVTGQARDVRRQLRGRASIRIVDRVPSRRAGASGLGRLGGLGGALPALRLGQFLSRRTVSRRRTYAHGHGGGRLGQQGRGVGPAGPLCSLVDAAERAGRRCCRWPRRRRAWVVTAGQVRARGLDAPADPTGTAAGGPCAAAPAPLGLLLTPPHPDPQARHGKLARAGINGGVSIYFETGRLDCSGPAGFRSTSGEPASAGAVLSQSAPVGMSSILGH